MNRHPAAGFPSFQSRNDDYQSGSRADYSPNDREKSPIPGRRVLVVDDESLIRFALREQLERAGFEVIEAEDVRSAQGLLAESDGLGAAFLDLRLPDGDGMELLKEIRAGHPGCRVVMMSAYGTSDRVEDALRLGAWRFVDKPFDYPQLVAAVAAVLDV